MDDDGLDRVLGEAVLDGVVDLGQKVGRLRVERHLDLVAVVDVGCGGGAWLAEFLKNGAVEVLGIDGDYVDRARLLIPPAAFLAHDLRRPLELDRRFDLALSLEAAQYLPPAGAPRFVAALTELAPVVLFSSAVPHQAENAPNTQWPDYWCRLFAERDYEAYDWLRPLIWNDERVEFWYAQNAVLFARPGAEAVRRLESGPVLPLVHPKLYLSYAETRPFPIGRARTVARRLAWRLLR